MLPKINTSDYPLTLPLTKKQMRFRPFLAREEKIMLTAIEGYNSQNVQDSTSLVDAVFSVMQNCVTSGDVDVTKLPSVDVEYLFVNIRKKSVGEIVEAVTEHSECGHINNIKIDLDKLELVGELPKNIVMLTPTVGVTLRYPQMQQTLDLAKAENKVQAMYGMICSCIDKIIDGDNFLNVDEVDPKELEDWVGQFTTDQMAQVFSFFDSVPHMEIKTSYTCEGCGQQVEMEVRGTTSFFM